ncbi:MAG: hypothetical protein CMI31_14930 [Opitutae bacterium]|nr:hypothetical protein [Opitutae bacterium]
MGFVYLTIDAKSRFGIKEFVMTVTEGVGKNEMEDANRFAVAFFVTSHGFGHAARACAVAEALRAKRLETDFGFYTEVPAWFFEHSLGTSCVHRPCQTDVGLIQDTPFIHDVEKTLIALREFFPFRNQLVEQMASELGDAGCRLVVCDASSLGIEVANLAGLPSVLLENFTWDWVYEDFLEQEPRFEPFVDGLRETYAKADHHIQTEPLCQSTPGASLIPPISRAIRTTRLKTRDELGVPEAVNLGLLTTGGIRGEIGCLEHLQETDQSWFIVPGGCEEGLELRGNVVLLSHRSGFHHPDLATASDFLVGKAGYGTIAEARAAGASFAYVLRENFRESACLREYLAKEKMGFEISEEAFHSASWLDRLDELLLASDQLHPRESGATEVAEALANWL